MLKAKTKILKIVNKMFVSGFFNVLWQSDDIVQRSVGHARHSRSRLQPTPGRNSGPDATRSKHDADNYDVTNANHVTDANHHEPSSTWKHGSTDSGSKRRDASAFADPR